jgi:hypothetical protein
LGNLKEAPGSAGGFAVVIGGVKAGAVRCECEHDGLSGFTRVIGGVKSAAVIFEPVAKGSAFPSPTAPLHLRVRGRLGEGGWEGRVKRGVVGFAQVRGGVKRNAATRR